MLGYGNVLRQCVPYVRNSDVASPSSHVAAAVFLHVVPTMPMGYFSPTSNVGGASPTSLVSPMTPDNVDNDNTDNGVCEAGTQSLCACSLSVIDNTSLASDPHSEPVRPRVYDMAASSTTGNQHVSHSNKRTLLAETYVDKETLCPQTSPRSCTMMEPYMQPNLPIPFHDRWGNETWDSTSRQTWQR